MKEIHHEEVATPTETIESIRGYRFALDPNNDQQRLLSQYAGASRWAYNQLVAINRQRLARRTKQRQKLLDAGVTDSKVINQRLKALDTILPAEQKISAMSGSEFQKNYLTPMRQHHAELAARIAAGEPSSQVMSGEPFDEPWIHTIPRRVHVSGVRNADAAMQNFFASATGARAGDRMGLPQFKKRGDNRDSFTFPHPEVMGVMGTVHNRGKSTIRDHRHVYFFGKLGAIRTHQSTARLYRAVQRGAMIKSVTVTRKAHRWYASFLVSEHVKPRQPSARQRNNGAVGVDLGVSVAAALSTGEVVENPRYYQQSMRRLKKLQQKLSRSQRGSARRLKLINQIGALHHKVALQRKNHLDHISKHLTTAYELIGIEDLNVRGMTRSAKGTVENPGKNVKAKSGLNRSILDVGFGSLRSMLEYKAADHGSQLVAIDRFFPSSKLCSNCGATKLDLSLSDRLYVCDCGLSLDRDVNAAINIAQEAQRVHASREAVSDTV